MRAGGWLCLLVALSGAVAWSAADRGQSPPPAAEPGALLPIDEAAFEVAVTTGGFYAFWEPGEFSRVAAEDAAALLVGSGETLEQIDGRVQGVLDVPFEVEPGSSEITVRVGLQGRGAIELWAPGARQPYTGDPDLRTTHMRLVRTAQPKPGTWTVRLAGSGLYLVNVSERRGDDATGSVDPEPCPSGARSDLECFRAASPDARWDLFRRLPAPRRQELARALLDDPDPRVAYVAAGRLARDGRLEEAVPVFARILVRGENESALDGRMGYDWIHDDDDTLADRILDALAHHLRSRLGDYAPAERERAEAFLRTVSGG